MKKNIYTYNWTTLLDTRNEHSTVNQLYFKKINFKIKKNLVYRAKNKSKNLILFTTLVPNLHSLIPSFIYPFNEYLLSTCCVPGSGRGTEDSAVNKSDTDLPLLSCCSWLP